MGYTLKIGEATTEWDEDYMEINVRDEKFKDAPADGVPTDHTNKRWPSYAGWEDFCDAVNLRDLFYNEDEGLIAEHPGVKPLTMKHYHAIDEAYNTYAATVPPTVNIHQATQMPYNVNRLKWLKFWVDWALTNCEKPVFYNS